MKNYKNILIMVLLFALIGVATYAYNIKAKQIKDCNAMGYTKTEADCRPNELVRCMYDLSKVYCRNAGVK